VAPTSSGVDYPGDKAKAGTRVSVAEGGGGTYPETGHHRVVCVLQHVLGGHRRCRVAPTSSAFDYHGDEAKAGTRVRVCRHGAILCLRARAQVEAQRHFLSEGALPRGGKHEVTDPVSVGLRSGAGGGTPGGGAQGRQVCKGGKAGGGAQGRQGRQKRQARRRGARAARAARPAARATSPWASVASPAAKHGVGKGGKAGERGGGGEDDKGGKAGDAGGLPCGARGSPGGAAVAAGGASDLPCGAATTAGGSGELPCGACGLPGGAAGTAGGADDLPCGYVR